MKYPTMRSLCNRRKGNDIGGEAASAWNGSCQRMQTVFHAALSIETWSQNTSKKRSYLAPTLLCHILSHLGKLKLLPWPKICGVLDVVGIEMWLVLAAAGSGYLARCWQNAEKAKHAYPKHSTCTQDDESIKSLETPLGGNKSPNSPAARASQDLSVHTVALVEELCNDDSSEGLETSHDGKYHAAGCDEVVWKDRDNTSLEGVNEASTLFSHPGDTSGDKNSDGNAQKESASVNALKSDGSYLLHTAPVESDALRSAIESKGPEESLKGRGASVNDPLGSFSSGRESPLNAQVETGVHFQAQSIYRNSRTFDLHSLGAMDELPEKTGTELGSNVSSTARVSLGYLKKKHLRELRDDAGVDGHEGIGSAHSKTKFKCGDERITNMLGRHSSTFKALLVSGSGCQDFSQPPRGCTQKGSYTRRLRTPNRSFKCRPLGRKGRVMRASPKPLSSLECCLMAQLDALDADLGRHVSRPLDFSSVVDSGKGLGNTEHHNMRSFEGACQDSDADFDEHGRGEELSAGHLSGLRGVVSPVQVLLFFIAVGVGAMYANKCHKSEVEGLQQSLKEAESEVQVLRRVLQQHGLSVPELNFFSKVDRVDTGGGPMAGALEGVDESDDFASLRVLVTEGTSSMQDDQMADLEAELEAELDYLTGQFADDNELELDGVAHVVHGDLNVKGLPANEDSDGDDNSAPEVACINNYAVSPRELTRLLRKLQATRQEEHISELEADLERLQSQLESREKELQLWKGRVRRLTEFSLASSVQGDENVLLSTPSSGVITPFERPSPTTDSEAGLKTDIRDGTLLEGQGSVHPPVQLVASAGILKTSLSYSHHPAEKDTVGSGKQSMSGKGELRLTREVSFKESSREMNFPQTQKPAVDRRLSFGDRQNSSWITDEFCDEFLRSMEDSSVEVGPQYDQFKQLTDSKSLFEDSQIEQLLLDSVEDLGSLGSNTSSVYDYSTAATMADNWDNVLKSSTGTQNWSGSLHQKDSENTSRGYPLSEGRATGSPKSVSEHSDGEYSRADTLAPLKYIESNSRPQHPGDENLTPFYWNRDVGGLGRAGANTPVDSRYASNQSTKNASIDQKEPAISNLQVDLDSRVFDKVAGWDGLMRIDHSPAVRSDWECPSQSSESDQHGGTGTHPLISGTSCEESLVSEAEEYLGKILVGQMIERSRRSSHAGEEAQKSIATQMTIQAELQKHLSLPHEMALRKVRIKDGKASEEEEYELLCKSLPTNFEAVRFSDDRDCKRALFSEQMQSEGTTDKEVGVSKVYSWEECGKSPTRVGRQSLRGNPQQDSRFRHQNRVKEAWSKQRL